MTTLPVRLEEKFNSKRREETIRYLKSALKELQDEDNDTFDAASPARYMVRLSMINLDKMLKNFPETTS